MHPMPGWHKYSWMTEFCSNIPITEEHAGDRTSCDRVPSPYVRVAERENIDFDLKRCGILHFYRDKAGFEKAAR